MSHDLNMALMRATFKLEQRQDDGTSTVGTGWLVAIPRRVHGLEEDRIALVTAGHVFRRMKKRDATIHWRRQDDAGNWHREAKKLAIRRADDGPMLWTEHPNRDVAVIWVDPPDQPRSDAIHYDLLADEHSFAKHDIRPADEMMALGYPKGITANEAGFPILRSGRVASYPLWPVSDFPTFLMDFSVFAGNSGGPVYMVDRARRYATSPAESSAQIITGILAQQVMLTDERLEIGIVLHAAFVREALAQLARTTAGRKAWVGA